MIYLALVILAALAFRAAVKWAHRNDVLATLAFSVGLSAIVACVLLAVLR